MSGPASRLLSEQIEALRDEVADLRKLAGRVSALESRVGVAPRLPHFEQPSSSVQDLPPSVPGPIRDGGVRRDVLGTSQPEQ